MGLGDVTAAAETRAAEARAERGRLSERRRPRRGGQGAVAGGAGAAPMLGRRSCAARAPALGAQAGRRRISGATPRFLAGKAGALRPLDPPPRSREGIRCWPGQSLAGEESSQSASHACPSKAPAVQRRKEARMYVRMCVSRPERSGLPVAPCDTLSHPPVRLIRLTAGCSTARPPRGLSTAVRPMGPSTARPRRAAVFLSWPALVRRCVRRGCAPNEERTSGAWGRSGFRSRTGPTSTPGSAPDQAQLGPRIGAGSARADSRWTIHRQESPRIDPALTPDRRQIGPTTTQYRPNIDPISTQYRPNTGPASTQIDPMSTPY